MLNEISYLVSPQIEACPSDPLPFFDFFENLEGMNKNHIKC